MAEEGKYIGGGFLIQPVGAIKIFTPEEFTEEQLFFAKTTEEFMTKTILPREEEIEHQVEGVLPSLIKEAAKVDLLGLDVPEKYGGLEADKTTSMLVAEKLAAQGSFSVALGAHVGIGTLPIVFFGNEDQKKRYLPSSVTGEKLGCYCLTEPTAGTDAMGISTKATLSEDGKYYILNGTKQFITNAGFADYFIVYAKIDGEKFTAFIVDKGTPGLSVDAEEKKMGIKGSSTRSVILDNVKVPVENVLGEIGKGHKIAFNILNVGRFKLGVGALGGAKNILIPTIKYAKERKQFGRPIASFGAIQSKIARSVSKIFVGESMSYRVAGAMDERIKAIDKDAPDAYEKTMAAIEEFAIEDSIMKVYGSETLDFVVDECLQIYGGYGYTQEYPAEKAYRDSRINRIFEGTNEINRMLIPGTFLGRAMKGKLPLMALSQKIESEINSGNVTVDIRDESLKEEIKITEICKKVVIYCLSAAVKKFMQNIKDEQEILTLLADCCIALYGMDSALARVIQTKKAGGKNADAQLDATRLFIVDGRDEVEKCCKRVLCALYDEKKASEEIAKIDKVLEYCPINTVAAERNLAKRTLDAGKYDL